MATDRRQALGRRQFLEYLLQSPLLAAGGASAMGAWSAGSLWAQDRSGIEVASAQEAANVFDMMAAAEKKLSPGHFRYIMNGFDATVLANLDGFKKLQIRPRRFVDTTRVDTSVEIMGRKYASPIFLAPAGSHRAFHPDGELASARAARAKGRQMILSGVTNYPINEVVREFQAPVWYQLYQTDQWSVTEAVVRRAEDSGASVLVLLVDRPWATPAGGAKAKACQSCHEPGAAGFVKTHPAYQGIDISKITTFNAPVTWDLVDRIRKVTKMKLFAKGVMTGEDAALCVRQGLDGLIVSNHAGREDTGQGTIEVLPEVVAAVRGRIPVLIDGGFRRGTDVFKALALGANAICIGRPYLWGLSAFGQEGVERVLELMNTELAVIMTNAGTTSVDKITSNYVRYRPA
jgi:isopentenyl diphosphate isomerase/L-lactate dehydrogenase-like FMN-dependent dehydrogenase